jgi:hypothetical protein
MAKITIMGDAAVVTSQIKTKDLETLKKFKPTALKLVDKDKKETYFCADEGEKASFSKHGIVFTGTDGNGNAIATLALPTGLEADKKADYVKNNYGYGLLNLNVLEAQVNEVVEDTADEFAAMAENIQVL